MPRNLLFCTAFLLAACANSCTSRTPETQTPPRSVAAPALQIATEAPEIEPSAEAEPTAAAEPTPRDDAATLSDLPLQLPAPAVKPTVDAARVKDFQTKIDKYGLFDAYRGLTKLYLDAGLYEKAAQTLRQEAARYRVKKMDDAAIIDENRAARYDPTTAIYRERKASAAELKTLYSGAPLEPLVGCYLGAFIDRSDAMRDTYQDENFQTHRYAKDWKQLTGRGHGTHFMYLAYGQKFPRAWVEELKSAGIIPQIAWEPKSLNEVRDDKYLQTQVATFNVDCANC